VGAVVNYLLNYHLTFRSRSSHQVVAPRFALVAVLGAVINASLVLGLVRLGAHYLAAQVAATLFVLVAGFNANLRWTFSDRSPERNEHD
jgi:putative flippase GtrA